MAMEVEVWMGIQHGGICHTFGGGAEIFCPLAKRHMKRIIFIIPTPTDGQFPRPSGGASTIRVQHPASRIQHSVSKIQQAETRIRMESPLGTNE